MTHVATLETVFLYLKFGVFLSLRWNNNDDSSSHITSASLKYSFTMKYTASQTLFIVRFEFCLHWAPRKNMELENFQTCYWEFSCCKFSATNQSNSVLLIIFIWLSSIYWVICIRQYTNNNWEDWATSINLCKALFSYWFRIIFLHLKILLWKTPYGMAFYLVLCNCTSANNFFVSSHDITSLNIFVIV